MSSFEIPAPQPSENPNVDVSLPYEVDDAWCAEFNARYGYTGKRAVINAYAVLRRAKPFPGFRRPNMPITLRSDDFGELPPEGLSLDGEVINARMVPFWDDYSEEYEYVLHLSMRDVFDTDGDKIIAGPHEEIWIPLTENGDSLFLY